MKMPGMQETQVQSLGREEALEKGMATHSSIIAWRIPWAEEPGRLCPWGLFIYLFIFECLLHAQPCAKCSVYSIPFNPLEVSITNPFFI